MLQLNRQIVSRPSKYGALDMEMAELVTENGIQKEQTQNLQLKAGQVASSGGYEAIRREQILARRARKAMRSKAETEEIRKARLAKDAERVRLRRLAETEEEKRARLAKGAENIRLRRLAQTEEEKKARLAKHAEKLRLRRREQKEKSKHSGTDAEIRSTSEMIHSQTDSDKCEEGQGGSQQSETSSEQIAPSTSSKTTVEHEPSKEDLTPKRLDESKHRKERLAKVIDKVKLKKVKEIDQQIKRCYARITEVIGTDGLLEISHSKKNLEEEAKEHTSPSSATLPGNKVNKSFAHSQESILHSLLFMLEEVPPPEHPLHLGKEKEHDAGSDQQLVSRHGTDAIDPLQPLPVESGAAGDVLENEGHISRNSQSPDIVIIGEIVKVADKIGTPIAPQKQPDFNAGEDRGQTEISRPDVEQLSDNEKPKSLTRIARRARARRWAETEQQKKDRLAREAKRARLKRLAETEEQKRARLAKTARNAKLWRSRAREQNKEGTAEIKS